MRVLRHLVFFYVGKIRRRRHAVEKRIYIYNREKIYIIFGRLIIS